jgi:thymidylate synthase
MYVIRGRNVHSIFPVAVEKLLVQGVKRDSRNGPVLMFPEPVTTVYERPEERVIFYPERDANPFFHLAEALWMLGGRNDVAFVAKYVKRMAEYSDDGKTFHGAYGHRWRSHFGKDQLKSIIFALRKNKDDRRQVLAMWDATSDLGGAGKDLPCNTQAVFQVACDGRLDMTVTNRSNDMIWGTYGANAVHFSILHEYMAQSVGVPLGIYRQVSTNTHMYESTAHMAGVDKDNDPDPYPSGSVRAYPLMTMCEAHDGLLEGMRECWEEDLRRYLMKHDITGGLSICEDTEFIQPFFRKIAIPLAQAYRLHKTGRREEALRALENMPADCDWRKAATEWLERRYSKDGAE